MREIFVSFARTSKSMNHFQRLNEVKELKIFFFAQRANTRKQASSSDALVPTVQNRAGAVIGWHVSAQKTSSYITARPWLPGLIVGPCPSEESLCWLSSITLFEGPSFLAYWLFASPNWTVCAGVVGVALSAKKTWTCQSSHVAAYCYHSKNVNSL